MTDEDINEPEIERRVEGFDSGDITCACGYALHLYWNGGELDDVECRGCGRRYRTVHVRTDLLVYPPPPGWAPPKPAFPTTPVSGPYRVYDAPEGGNLVAEVQPGEEVRLPEGQYFIHPLSR